MGSHVLASANYISQSNYCTGVSFCMEAEWMYPLVTLRSDEFLNIYLFLVKNYVESRGVQVGMKTWKTLLPKAQNLSYTSGYALMCIHSWV